MNQRTPDIDRVLSHWLEDGPSTMPDRVVDVVADRIGLQPQRSRWRLRGRPFMTTPIKLAAGLAAVLVVAVVTWQLLPGDGGPGSEPSPTPIPTPTPALTSTPAPTGPIALPAGLLPGGSYLLQPFLPGPSTIAVVADIPEGWRGVPEVPGVMKPDENTGILIAGMIADGLFSDPCRWDLDGTGSIDQPGDVEVGPTVDELVAALQANTSYSSSAATPVSIDGYEGQELELQLPGNDVISTCDRREGQSTGDYFVIPGGFYALGPNSRWDLFILDVDGTRLIVLVSIVEGTPEADVAAARAIVESFQITP